jgi:putative salt-induced outer membrane protein YdiY
MKVVCGVLALFLGSVLAVTGQAEEGGDATRETSFNAGLTLTDGNSDTLRANAGVLFEAEQPALGSVRAGMEGNYGETTTAGKSETDVENLKAFLDTRKTLTERTYASINTSAVYDDQALIDYRVIAGPGLGGLLYKDERGELSVEAGPAYLWEEVDGQADEYLVLRFAQRLDFKISETARFWQQVEYVPEAEDFDNYLLNSEIGVTADVAPRLALRVVLQSSYNNQPAADTERHDLTLISGLSFSL